MPSAFYALQAKTLQNKAFDFKALIGKPVLIVNVASKCGYTQQYKGLEELHQKYKDQGLVVLGFPCNQFGGQEPGSAAEIQSFCEAKYGVTFQKTDVNGKEESSVFNYLKSQASGDIAWNFEKFIVDREGKVVSRFPSSTTPAALHAAVEKVL